MLIATQFKPMPFEWPLPGQEPRDFRVLVVDDQEIVRIMLIKILQRNGFEVLEAASGPETLTLLERERVDLILSDIKMPGMNGIELVKAIQPRIPETSIVMVSSLDNVEMSMECLRLGAYGYVLKPFKTNGILVAVANALRRRMLELHFRDREAILAQKVREQTTEIRQSREEIAFRLLAASEHRDNETGAHVRRIGLYAAAMGRILGMDENTLEHLGAAAQMHDIGKIGVPDRILQKDGHLTPEEWIIMKTHTTMGANILRDSAVPFIEMGARIAACHHEKFDGTGYPVGQGRSSHSHRGADHRPGGCLRCPQQQADLQTGLERGGDPPVHPGKPGSPFRWKAGRRVPEPFRGIPGHPQRTPGSVRRRRIPEMNSSIRILAVNPGSTSTRIALFEGTSEQASSELTHLPVDLRCLPNIQDQLPLRLRAIQGFLEAQQVQVASLDAVVGRGGAPAPPSPRNLPHQRTDAGGSPDGCPGTARIQPRRASGFRTGKRHRENRHSSWIRWWWMSFWSGSASQV